MSALDYAKLNELSSEAQQLQMAMTNLDNGGRITMMTIGPGKDQFTMPAVVQTGGIEYPATMVEAIKTALDKRYQDASDEIRQLTASATAVKAKGAR